MNNNLPTFPDSIWYQELDFPAFPSLNCDITVDVTIVGGGITGITSAYLLSNAGLKVALIDAGKIFNGTTGHTTAKVTAQHGVIYDELIKHFGEDGAKQYYQAADRAKNFIKETIQKLSIECDFQEHNAYIYTNSENEINKLENEAKAYEKLDIPGCYLESMPLKIPMKAAIMMEKQAQFHPLKYLLPLVKSIKENGSLIFENTTAKDIETGTNPQIITRKGHRITARNIIIASHFPFYEGFGFYFARMYAERSYVVAVKSTNHFPGGMYLSSETPTRSIRSTPMGKENLLLLGGEGHKTGQGINTMEHYDALARFGQEHFASNEIQYRWSAQDLYTLDKVPYIGRITEGRDNIFVATGFRKWGMTNSTNAALIIADLILKGSHPYEDLFSPSRFKADPSIKAGIDHNLTVAKEFIKGKIEFLGKLPEEVDIGEGTHVNVNGKKACAYRDSQGVLHLIDATCTHMGCEVEWNDGENTWDCPCHGSRYSVDGDVIEGPALNPLKKLSIESEE